MVDALKSEYVTNFGFQHPIAQPLFALQYGRTPLHEAAGRGHAAVVGQLLAAGAAVDAKDEVWGVGADECGLGGRTQLCVSSWISFFVLLTIWA